MITLITLYINGLRVDPSKLSLRLFKFGIFRTHIIFLIT